MNNQAQVYYFSNLDSTSKYLKELISQGVSSNTVIWADKQSQGKGRQGREWISPPGGLYFSVLLFSSIPVKPAFSLVAGEAVVEALKLFSNKNIQIKWPNDIMVSGRKVAGILCESLNKNLIVGVGLNIKHPAKIPKKLKGKIGYLSDIECIPREKILEKILTHLFLYWEHFQKEGFSPFRERQLQLAYLLNREIIVDDCRGRMVDYGPSGELILLTEENERKKIIQGSVKALGGN